MIRVVLDLHEKELCQRSSGSSSTHSPGDITVKHRHMFTVPPEASSNIIFANYPHPSPSFAPYFTANYQSFIGCRLRSYRLFAFDSDVEKGRSAF